MKKSGYFSRAIRYVSGIIGAATLLMSSTNAQAQTPDKTKLEPLNYLHPTTSELGLMASTEESGVYGEVFSPLKDMCYIDAKISAYSESGLGATLGAGSRKATGKEFLSVYGANIFGDINEKRQQASLGLELALYADNVWLHANKYLGSFKDRNERNTENQTKQDYDAWDATLSVGLAKVKRLNGTRLTALLGGAGISRDRGSSDSTFKAGLELNIPLNNRKDNRNIHNWEILARAVGYGNEEVTGNRVQGVIALRYGKEDDRRVITNFEPVRREDFASERLLQKLKQVTEERKKGSTPTHTDDPAGPGSHTED